MTKTKMHAIKTLTKLDNLLTFVNAKKKINIGNVKPSVKKLNVNVWTVPQKKS